MSKKLHARQRRHAHLQLVGLDGNKRCCERYQKYAQDNLDPLTVFYDGPAHRSTWFGRCPECHGVVVVREVAWAARPAEETLPAGEVSRLAEPDEWRWWKTDWSPVVAVALVIALATVLSLAWSWGWIPRL